jgi:hypothetical protein
MNTHWMLMVSCTPWQLCSTGKNHHHPLGRGLSGPQSRYGRGGEKIKSLPLPLAGINPGRPGRTLVTMKYILYLNMTIIMKERAVFRLNFVWFSSFCFRHLKTVNMSPTNQNTKISSGKNQFCQLFCMVVKHGKLLCWKIINRKSFETKRSGRDINLQKMQ